MKDFFYVLKSYIKTNIFIYAVYLTVLFVFGIIFYLYSLPFEPIVYALILSLVAIIIFEIIRFYRFFSKHKKLSCLKKEIEFTIENLPEFSSILEEDYQEMLKVLNDNKNSLISEYDMKMSDMQDYYSMWAHQIKTPIAAMNLILQCDENDINDSLMNQLFRIEQYVDMVMQYLRADNMSGDIVIENCSLDSIVKAAVRKYSRQFIGKKISLNLDEIDCHVLTDEKWLQFVIEQIISNALKYTNQGSISIYMDEKLPRTLVIEDTGIGIRKEDLPRIFENGFTGYNGRADKRSTGIGLYLCKKILDKLSHTISAESEIDKGTIVKIGLGRQKSMYE
jgi:signal transduction histidine kinase